MKITRELVTNVAVGLFVALGLTVVAVRGSTTTTVAARPTPSADATLQPTVKPSTVTPVVPNGTRPALIRQVNRFIQTYYLVLPGETVAHRRARLYRLHESVPSAVISRLPLPPGAQPAHTDNGKTLPLTMRGSSVTSAISVHENGEPAGSVYVVAPVKVSVLRPDGSVATSYTVLTSTIWTFQSPKWVLTEFTEGGDE